MTLNLMIVAVFAVMAAAVTSAAKYQVKSVLYGVRQAQAQAIAEAGMDDALHSLLLDNSWRAGFSNKAFAGGKYTVTLSTDTSVPPRIVATGYSTPIPLFGPAVRTVSATALFQSFNCTKAIQADSGITLNGGSAVNAYDPFVSLTPSSFTAGADIWSNANILASGACPPSVVNGNASAIGSLPAACYVAGTRTTATVPLPIPSHPCGNCATVNSGLTGIGPQSAFNSSSKQLVVNNETVVLEPGRYYFKKITVKNNGILNFNTSTGTVTIFMDGNMTTTAPCQMNNTSKIPARLQFYDIANAGHSVPFNCSTPLHAYIEGVWAQADVNQQIYGHFCSDRVTLEAGAGIHYDSRGGSVSHVTWTTGPSGSWSESYTRQ